MHIHCILYEIKLGLILFIVNLQLNYFLPHSRISMRNLKLLKTCTYICKYICRSHYDLAIYTFILLHILEDSQSQTKCIREKE